MQSSLRIIVTGLITQHPHLGGMTWHYLQYLIGLKRLGHEVYYFEDSGEFPYNLDGGPSGIDWIAKDCSYNVNYLAEIMGCFGLENRWAYFFPLKSEWYGLSDIQREKVINSTSLLINVSGSLEHPYEYRRIPHLIYIDTDPVITQIKIASGNTHFIERVAIHDRHFSFGEKLSDGVPETPYQWHPTRQPIVLSEWQSSTPLRGKYTTVMSWTSYEPLVHSGRIYGQKNIEFQRFLELPKKVAPAEMEVALSRTQHKKWLGEEEKPTRDYGELTKHKKGYTPYDLLTHYGWRVVDAFDACGNYDSYRYYIQSSKAEWSVAKNAYVQGQPGWFSERSACYLAAGRPVVVQDTGFSAVFPTGNGLLSFKTLEQAIESIQEVEANYTRHSQAARAIAETYFDSDKVLTNLIEMALRKNNIRKGTTQLNPTTDRTITPAVLKQPKQIKKQKTEKKRGKILRTNLHEHPAVKAWSKLYPSYLNPKQIEVLKQKSLGAVYRLDSIGPEYTTIIAKRIRHERAVIERPVYEEVLPQLPVSTIKYYGCVEEDDRFWWIFLEDVGNVRFSPFVKQHLSLGAQWLGMMHISAERIRVKTSLPDRGPDHYLMYLHSAIKGIPKIKIISSLQYSTQTIFQNIVSMCAYLEDNWTQIENFCDQTPRTFIHGDCLVKNVHVHATKDGLTIAPFDWGGAGWGFPATDLGQLGLPYHNLPLTDPDYVTYLSVVQGHWSGFDLHKVEQLGNLGQLFWSLKVISRSLPEFENKNTDIKGLVNKYNVYKTVLTKTIRAARWEF